MYEDRRERTASLPARQGEWAVARRLRTGAARYPPTSRLLIGRLPLLATSAALLTAPAVRGREGGQGSGELGRIREESFDAHTRHYVRAVYATKAQQKAQVGTLGGSSGRRQVSRSGRIAGYLLQNAADHSTRRSLMASGPHHFRKAEELLLEIEATPSISNATETSLAIRAVAHAVLAEAAASALAGSGPDKHAWHEIAGVHLGQ